MGHLAGEFAGPENAENSFNSVRDTHDLDAAGQDDENAMVGASLIEEDLARYPSLHAEAASCETCRRQFREPQGVLFRRFRRQFSALQHHTTLMPGKLFA